MNINTPLEEKLVEQGYHTFSLQEKNSLIAILANREDLVYSDIDEDYILTYHKSLKEQLLAETCEATILEGFTASNGHFYRTNRDDQVNMIGQKDELNADPTITAVPWKTEDAGYIVHTKEEWLEVYKEAFGFKKTQLFKYNTLKQRVAAATQHDEIVAITWDADEVTPPTAPETPQEQPPTEETTPVTQQSSNKTLFQIFNRGKK
ncbi:hypothetical protein ACFX4N_23555 [Priestia sp. YIM B13551]|uniref:DUF4376 domain-containing protein n=1 Tax=Priestia sp. YIM B13551 TaxID=3366306 RepID=UPI00366C3FD6